MDSPTRLILSNLPPSLTTPLLRSHLARCPPAPPRLTDCKILLKPDGTSRRIAFLGFNQTDDARRVLEWVAGTWIQGTHGGARINADWAKDAQDAPRPKKRAKLSASPSEAPTSLPVPAANDEQDRFAEFMAVMAPRRNRAVEENPEAAAASLLPSAPAPAPIYTPSSTAPVATKVETTTEPPAAEEARDGAAEDESLTDLEYMARRMKRSLEDAAGDDEDTPTWEQDEEDRPAEVEGTGSEPEPVDELNSTHRLLLDTARLFLRNLAFTITEADLRALLEPFGELHQIHIPMDPATQSGKGLAYATFASGESAVRAFEELDRRSFQGRLLHILPAIGRQTGETSSGKPATLKGERLEARKTEASKGLSWGTLYMNSDAVMSSVADRLKVSKSELLDPSSNNAAVRLALAETHVIAETKKYFENEGVDLASLASRGPRSSTTILVKNIPYNTTTATLSALFAPFGTIARLLLPPAGTMAIVEMGDPTAASDAWRNLVYKKLGGSVLYLEKAAAGVWNGAGAAASQSTSTTTSPTISTPSEDAGATGGEEGSTLFVKNLSFATTSDTLKAAFASLPDFLFARVQTKPNPKEAGRTLSMGFGFVGFRTAAAAAAALKAKDKFFLEGHQLEIRFAQRGKESSTPASSSKSSKSTSTSTKLIVKNIPFEATRKEIRELFSAYGQLKSVRLPRKFDHKTRGFAFLDFASRRDAEAAFGALEHTHLLGRHLVLQWAEEGEADVDGLRARTGFSETKIGGRKAKFAMTQEPDSEV
ncbi:hypothetical protein BCR35DRAFT_302638 [Leucosporidium creatinivorum]|uniref:RRM domain-containing protein n=1 Tax=Leucosporidium creatinivorum TaxID=106004 RepID=A0A1Y2FTI7_9BASI|nr:hypothetical protein BCR35DRAFT_302638 [Leucosporidium creatinivorum]